MANPEVNDSLSDALKSELRKQVRAEIDGETVTNPERFALEQKYGLTEPVLTADELLAGVLDGGAR